ncbi:hypothetical protein MWU57_08025 [Isoptericola sp. S6320L]|uniref:hypothetical protein n=1 Tax=Isoptericola sp. S6320L TaxID=2926411 RepID=UPI001FF343EB|nr:hypothetical protein [Isoptericola sp. S6320L]MCK0116981.1 hypothetical protein [Isoptericola sp. S6320L]
MRKAARRAAKEARTQLAHADVPTSDADALPRLSRRRAWGRLTRGGMWGPAGVGVPKHVTSAARIGVLTPFVAPTATSIPGPVIGIEATSGQPFTFDPWGAVQSKHAASPGVVAFGLQGTGKSFCVKTAMLREIGWGRQVIVSSDPKGEWVPLAGALGGQVVAVGPGSGNVINPLDEGIRPPDVGPATWRGLVGSRRSLALESICTTLRPGRVLDEFERTVLDRAVEAVSSGAVVATVAAVVDWLAQPPSTLSDELGDAGAGAPTSLRLVLGRLVRGPLAGMFDGESTVALDPVAPITVIDTSAIVGAAPELRAIAQAATSAWIDATLRSGDGRWRCVVSEEGWDELRNRAQARAMDERLRMTSQWRCSNWLIFHELADITQFGEAGSAHRNQVKGIITKSAIKILYKQSAASMALLDEIVRPTQAEADPLMSLPQGVGVWHIGESTPVLVAPVAGPTAYALINTSAGREG